MHTVRLTKRLEFSAAHRYRKPGWSEERNRAVFGRHNNPHGHNYLLEVIVSGAIDPVTGMVINLYDLKQVLKQVLVEFDHKSLNEDTPYFKDRIPTTENFAVVLWDKIVEQLRGARKRRSEEHTSELQSPCNLVCRLLLEKKKTKTRTVNCIS